jgi:nicotinamidase-related amidase
LYCEKSDLKNWSLQYDLTTLLFAGVQTDACVLISWQDASLAGLDKVLMRDVSTTGGETAVRKKWRQFAKRFGAP